MTLFIEPRWGEQVANAACFSPLVDTPHKLREVFRLLVDDVPFEFAEEGD